MRKMTESLRCDEETWVSETRLLKTAETLNASVFAERFVEVGLFEYFKDHHLVEKNKV